MSRAKAVDATYVIRQTRERLNVREAAFGGGEWIEGCVKTPEGYVWCYCDQPSKWNPKGFALLSVIRDGVEYERRLDRNFTKRGLAIMAGRFAREVVDGGQ